MIKISIKIYTYVIVAITFSGALNAHAASGEEVYKSACSTCHDSGAGQAPRVTHRDEWLPRWQRGRDAMHEAGIKGVPNTAMAAKGGFSKLSDEEVKAAVDYILARTGFQESLVVKSAATGASAVTQSSASGAAVDDNTLQKQVAEALRNGMAAGAQIENVEGKLLVRGVNIRVSVRGGTVTLEGMPEKRDIITNAEKIARSVNGVRRVDNKMVAAGLLDWD